MELKVALPGDTSYSWYQNAYDARVYKRLCTEFRMAPATDWRQKLDHGCQGLGSWTTYMGPSGAYRHAHYSDGPVFHPMDAIRHNRDISGAWTMFSPDKSEGFTQAGVERLNDSIRTYVWAILGAQAQTRSNILKAGMGFDTQKQRRRCNCFPSRHPQQHRLLQEDSAIGLYAAGLCLRVRALPRPERHGPPPGQCPGLQQRNCECWI